VLKEPVNKEKNIIIYIAGDESLVSDNTKTKVNDSGENKKTETNDTKKTDDKTKGEENKERVLNIDGEKLPGYILFPFDKAFTREYDEILDKVAAYLVQHPELSLVLTGHTDYMGKFKYNMELSKRRADFVKKYLQKKGVKKEQMFVYYKGEKEPAAQNTSKEGRKYNRRVDMQFKDTSALNLKLESIQIPEEYRIK
jgi:outer membrane protein OmpA-like peptidoglycan-associated protein